MTLRSPVQAVAHLAVVADVYLRRILLGRKTVESRLMRTRREPWGRVRPGDTIYFKASGGPVIVSAVAVRVRQFERLTPAGVRELRRRHNVRIGADASYWSARRGARYAVLVWLGPPRAVRTPWTPPPLHGRGWRVLGDPSSIE